MSLATQYCDWLDQMSLQRQLHACARQSAYWHQAAVSATAQLNAVANRVNVLTVQKALLQAENHALRQALGQDHPLVTSGLRSIRSKRLAQIQQQLKGGLTNQR